jgi:hypothetical protein
MGIAIITSDLSHYHRAWFSDKVGLKNLLRDIEAEVKIRIESRSDEFSALKSSQEKRLKRWSIFYFFILSCLILVPINWWFFKEVIDWNNAELFRPFTWVDKDKFGSGELIIGVFWLGIDGSYLANFIGLWRRFDRWYFKMFRAK